VRNSPRVDLFFSKGVPPPFSKSPPPPFRKRFLLNEDIHSRPRSSSPRSVKRGSHVCRFLPPLFFYTILKSSHSPLMARSALTEDIKCPLTKLHPPFMIPFSPYHVRKRELLNPRLGISNPFLEDIIDRGQGRSHNLIEKPRHSGSPLTSGSPTFSLILTLQLRRLTDSRTNNPPPLAWNL